MRRAGAGARYFFGAAYFDRVLEADGTWLALALSPAGPVAAASIAARSDGFLHYYLSGSADSHLRDSPMKNVVAALAELSIELDLPLNLGGGLARGDRLEEFKRGFANREQPWRTSELVCDPPAYARLSAGPRDGGLLSRLPAAGLAGRVFRRRAGEGEGFRRLPAGDAPGRLAEVADRVEGDCPLVLLAAEQVPPGGRRHRVGHFFVGEEQGALRRAFRRGP